MCYWLAPDSVISLNCGYLRPTWCFSTLLPSPCLASMVVPVLCPAATTCYKCHVPECLMLKICTCTHTVQDSIFLSSTVCVCVCWSLCPRAHACLILLLQNVSTTTCCSCNMLFLLAMHISTAQIGVPPNSDKTSDPFPVRQEMCYTLPQNNTVFFLSLQDHGAPVNVRELVCGI